MKTYLFHYLLLFFIAFLLIACETNKENIPTDFAADSGKSENEAVLKEVKDIWSLYNYDKREGKRIFEHYCSVCHGAGGEGDGFNSYNLNPKSHSFADSSYMSELSDSYLKQVISFGGQSMNKSVLMPAYGNTLSEVETDRVISFIRTLAEKDEQQKLRN